jgi:hypothetical protein
LLLSVIHYSKSAATALIVTDYANIVIILNTK